ncbi:single-stranded-DNA-specific exonuclease RecJ [Candidatus Dependentiae bacterium]|nr:single-stranded-DNA-specific exonuclease RecJ [Candidatus Dependentiae bacterium]
MDIQKQRVGIDTDSFQKYKRVKGEKFLWEISQTDIDQVLKISNEHNISLATANVLYSKGYRTKDQINSFLFVSKEKDVYDPILFKDSKIVLKRLLKAIDKKEKILIFGDYDVDGITSTSLLLISLLPLGANINFYLPNRRKEGYGLSSKVVKKAYENKYDLIITVDNGITAFQAADLASKLGIDLIITDHHRPLDKIPKALGIIDSNQKDCCYPYKELAGVGTIFKIICMIYDEKGLILPDKIYELLMLGTVADVAPLTGENRYWVRFGLNKINKKKSLALSSLIQNSRLSKSSIDSRDIGFMIAPQINALGRLDDPREAVEFLISSDKKIVEKIGLKLKRINEERKKLDRRIYLDIETAILERRINLEKENIIIAASPDWPAGVIGLVAGKLTQNYGKPSILFHMDRNGVLKGSCRSIPEFNIFDALNNCKDLLIQFGGHSFAAGLKLLKKNMPKLKVKLEELIKKEVDPKDLVPKLKVDAQLNISELNYSFLSEMEKLEPFGNQNEQPVFLLKDVTLQGQPQILKERHVKSFIFSNGVIKPVIFFNRPELFSFFNSLGDRSFDLVAYISKNEWNNKINIELQGLDVKLS